MIIINDMRIPPSSRLATGTVNSEDGTALLVRKWTIVPRPG